MTIYEAGDLVEVPFPFIDSGAVKRRPALVLSSPGFQELTGACVLTMVTSAERSQWGNDVVVEDWRSAGLKKPSLIRFKIFTLDETLILGQRGRLAERDAATVVKSLGEIFPDSFQNPTGR